MGEWYDERKDIAIESVEGEVAARAAMVSDALAEQLRDRGVRLAISVVVFDARPTGDMWAFPSVLLSELGRKSIHLQTDVFGD